MNKFMDDTKSDLDCRGEASYTVEHRSKCVLVFGAVPTLAFGALMKLAPKGAVNDVQLAHVAGSSMAIGLPEDTKKLIVEIAPDPLERARLSYAHTGLTETAIRWLALGDRSACSDAMFFGITGVKPFDMAGSVSAYPLDPDDFKYCRLLYEQIPEIAARLEAVSSVSLIWKQIVEAWYFICDTMDSECPNWRTDKVNAPKTHDVLLRETIISLNYL